MQIEFYPLHQLKKEILNTISKYLDTSKYRVFFFGSRVSGTNNQYSDIDVGIEGHNEIPREIMSKIKEDIENLPILYKIEVVDFKKVSSDFREVALSHYEYL